MIVYTKSIDTNLSELILDVSTGKIQLPEFQRDWRWDDIHIRSILCQHITGLSYKCCNALRIQKS